MLVIVLVLDLAWEAPPEAALDLEVLLEVALLEGMLRGDVVVSSEVLGASSLHGYLLSRPWVASRTD